MFCFKLQYTLSVPQRDTVPGACSHLYEKQFLMCWTYLGRLFKQIIFLKEKGVVLED